MDPSSEPGRDEYGLPPVDVEIPDDARDLDRDVQAYYRELRVRRRRLRMRRFTRPLTRHGMIIPLVTGCLALTLLSGTLLTLLAGHQAAPTPSASGRSAPPPTPGPPPLPDAQVTLDGKTVDLRTLVPAVLAWVPASCGCVAAVRQLAAQAAQANIKFYLVGNGREVPYLPGLASEVQPASHVVADDTDAVARAYQPNGLTAILANGFGAVGGDDVLRRLQSDDPTAVATFSASLRSLAATSQPAILAPSQSGNVSPAS